MKDVGGKYNDFNGVENLRVHEWDKQQARQ